MCGVCGVEYGVWSRVRCVVCVEWSTVCGVWGVEWSVGWSVYIIIALIFVQSLLCCNNSL